MTSPATASLRVPSHLVTDRQPLPHALADSALSVPTVAVVAPRAALVPAASAAVQTFPTTTAPQLVAPLLPASSAPAQTAGLIRTIKADDIVIEAQGAATKGSNGRVFRGLWGQEKVALKRLAVYWRDEGVEHEVEYNDDDESLRWEMSRMASVCHPNVVQFHGLCHKDGKTYLVMEWCDQGDLQDALRNGELGHARLWQWMLEISAGLAHLHGQGILHRDLKPANVLIDAHGRAKLADLGLAQVDALLEKTEIAAVNGGLQTPYIMAPEIRPDGEGRFNSKATDLYALGLVFWRMVNPGAPDASLEQLALGTNEYMVFPDHCPPAVKALILSCCHSDQQQRATIEEVQQQLQRMGPQLHAEHALIGMIEHLTRALHETRVAVRHYVPSQVTARRIESSIEHYWQIWEGGAPDDAFSAPTSTAQTASAAVNTASSSATTTTTANTTTSTAFDFAARSIVLANPPLHLQDRFDAFLAAPGSATLLLLGDAGLGKTLSTHVLAEQILQQWWRHVADAARHPKPACLPIVLRTHVADWSEGALKAAYAGIVRQYGLQPDQVTPLVIVDGYDEWRMEQGQPGNLAAHLGLPQGAKLIVTCRPDTVPEAQWQARFGFAGQLQVYHYLPFTSTQMLAYLQQHLGWDEATHAAYRTRLQGAQELRTVLCNPFVLHLLRQSWDTVRLKPVEQWTRSSIYADFIEHMVNSGRNLLANGVQQRLQAGHADLGASFQAFARQLAFLACHGRGMTLAVDAAQGTQSAWPQLSGLVQQEARQRFAAREEQLDGLAEGDKKEARRRMVLTQDDFVQMQRQAADKLAASLPLRQRGAHYEFVHKSVFEYCAAQQLLRLLNEEAESMTEETLKALLDWMEKTCPEVLMFAQESMPAVVSTAPATLMKQAGNLQAARGQCNEAWLLNAIGLVWRARGQYAKALEYCRRALVIREEALGEQHVDTASSYNNVGWVLDDQGQYAKALENIQKALTIREKLLGTAHVDTATSYNHIGSVLISQGQYVQALDYHRKALVIQEKVLGTKHVDTATSYMSIGGALYVQNLSAQALYHYRKALTIQEEVLGGEHIDVAATYSNIGAALSDLGQHAQALDYCGKAVSMTEKGLGIEHADTASSYSAVGRVLEVQGQPMQALAYYCKALAINEKVLGTEHATVAYSYSIIGELLRAQGQHVQAMDSHRKALAIREKVLGREHVATATSYNNIGSMLEAQGQYAQALECYREALTIKEQVLGTEHADTARSYNNIGTLLFDQGQHLQALDYCRKALCITEKLLGTEHADTATCYNNLGAMLETLEQYTQALECFRKALAIREKVLGTEHVSTAKSCNSIGATLRAQGQISQSLDYYRRALAIREKLLGQEHIDTGTSYNNIASTLKIQGQHAQALDYFRKALTIVEKVLGTEHVNTAITYNNIGIVLEAQGHHAQALDYYRIALAIKEKVLGTEHADTAKSCNNIGALLSVQGEHAQALDYFRKALAIEEKILGTEHADTAISYNNIGTLLHAQAQYAQALDYYRKALVIEEKVLGHDHIDTATSYNNIGTVLQVQGQHARALEYFRIALDIATRNNYAKAELYRNNVKSASDRIAPSDSICAVM